MEELDVDVITEVLVGVGVGVGIREGKRLTCRTTNHIHNPFSDKGMMITTYLQKQFYHRLIIQQGFYPSVKYYWVVDVLQDGIALHLPLA